MNAIKFIKDHGVEKARDVVGGAPEGVTHYGANNYWSWNGEILKRFLGKGFFIVGIYSITNEWVNKTVILSDLKRLVESVDLIKFYGGIEKAKLLLAMGTCLADRPPHAREVQLKQAIADYEAIGGEHV